MSLRRPSLPGTRLLEAGIHLRMLHDDRTGILSYFLADTPSARALLIDPQPPDLPVILALLEEFRCRSSWVCYTHSHLGPGPGAEPFMQSLRGRGIRVRRSANAKSLAFGTDAIQVLPTPGHTVDCRSYLYRDRLFCGDLLYAGDCPAGAFPVEPGALWNSGRKVLFELPEETLLYGAHLHHGRAVRLAFEEQRAHPWFSLHSRDAFLARIDRERVERAAARAGLTSAGAMSGAPGAASI